MPAFKIIAFDADDTLWFTERLYVRAQEQLRRLVAPYAAQDDLDERLYQTEMQNLEHFGYGIKAFALSMIETAIELTDGRIAAREIQQIISAARQMILEDVELIDHVAATIAELAEQHTLMVITKGDLRDQETKISRSGLADYFRQIEIVSDKNAQTYRSIIDRYAIQPAQFMMVGNSLRSDILPALEIGASAVFIPQELTWAHEAAETPPADQPGFHQLEQIGLLPDLVARLEQR